VVDYLRAHGLHWPTLFPPLQCSEAALAALEGAAAPVFFTGIRTFKRHGSDDRMQPGRVLPGPIASSKMIAAVT